MRHRQLGKVQVQSKLHSRHCSGLSSEPSSQSGSPSHCHRLGTHWPLLQTKSDSAHVFFTTKFFSSLPSAQSSSPSHFHNSVIQRPFVHWNWEGSHLAFLPKIRREHQLSWDTTMAVSDASDLKPTDGSPPRGTAADSVGCNTIVARAGWALGQWLRVTEFLAGHTPS
uniref:Uncharacterized protein n=1 Tax=Catagonus wagneri TaxID=51154 RepID=A0A8C3YRK5_9CETA